MNVGRPSASSNSTRPTEPKKRKGSPLSLASGEVAGARLDLSEVLSLGMLDGPGGLKPLKVPRARVTVRIPPSSRALLSILAAASELEKRAGNRGRMLRAEKKSGEGGWPSWMEWALRFRGKWPRECLPRMWRRRRLCRGSLAGSPNDEGAGAAMGEYANVDSEGRFRPATAGGVRTVYGPPVPLSWCSGAEPARRDASGSSSGNVGVHGGRYALEGCWRGVRG